MVPEERRRYIRHLLVNPLEFKLEGDARNFEKSETINASEGGLLFTSKKDVPAGSFISIQIPLYDKIFNLKAKVVHINKESDSGAYRIGVEFTSFSEAFKAKLMEQVYLIEEYRVLRSMQSGKEMGIQEASHEWLKRYSERFERLYNTD